MLALSKERREEISLLTLKLFKKWENALIKNISYFKNSYKIGTIKRFLEKENNEKDAFSFLKELAKDCGINTEILLVLMDEVLKYEKSISSKEMRTLVVNINAENVIEYNKIFPN